MSNQIAVMAQRLNIVESELESVVRKTIMPDSKKVTVSNEQFVSFMAVANEYNLNPLVKEIYAFPAKGGGIQPVVSIDGWIKIITNHPDFDGMEFVDDNDIEGVLISVTCIIHRRSMTRPISATEYMAECDRGTEPWKKWPRRMLRHKATIQAARYAFGISGIIEPDEAERFKEARVIKDITPTKKTVLIQDAARTSQQIFDDACEQIENCNHPGELQQTFGEAWSELKALGEDDMNISLKNIYDERKEYFEALESE